jgi:D-alanine-D-alanine ligase
MKKTIAIIAGGDSSEHGVSMRSAEGIYSWIDKEKFNVYVVEVNGLDWRVKTEDNSNPQVNLANFSFNLNGETIKPDYAYITIHGTPGENGILQGYFDLLKVPYSTCSLFVEALTFNKFALDQYLKSFGVKVADDILIRDGNKISPQEIVDKLGLPCFVKPNEGGSSFGVTKCRSIDDILPAVERASKESPEVLIESLIEGIEISNGVYGKADGSVCVLPITEIVSHNEFFDYGAKYNGEVEEITPARLNESTTARIKKLTESIYRVLGASGIIRVDYFVKKGENGADDTITLLEINTTPGMTLTSFIPQQVAAAGLEMKNVLTEVIEQKLK